MFYQWRRQLQRKLAQRRVPHWFALVAMDIVRESCRCSHGRWRFWSSAFLRYRRHAFPLRQRHASKCGQQVSPDEDLCHFNGNLRQITCDLTYVGALEVENQINWADNFFECCALGRFTWVAKERSKNHSEICSTHTINLPVN